MPPLSLDQAAPEMHPIDIIRDILVEVGTISKLMELHYLVQEPGMLDIMRSLSGLPDTDRAKLQEFLASHGNPSCLRVREIKAGMIRLEYEHGDRLEKSA